MPISKRINNLTLSSQCFGENDSTTAPNLTTDYLMAINNQNLQPNHYVEHCSPNQMDHHGNFHQSFVQPNNHSGAFNHLGANEYKTNQEHQHQMHHHQHHLANHQSTNSLDNELNNNGMEVYRPELTPDENPFYYNKNKLLFDLHIERQRRHPSS